MVDDVELQRDIASELLKELGYVVTTAATGEEAVSYLKKHPVDLVVLDMIMPNGMDGLETYEAIIKHRPGQKVVITSQRTGSAAKPRSVKSEYRLKNVDGRHSTGLHSH